MQVGDTIDLTLPGVRFGEFIRHSSKSSGSLICREVNFTGTATTGLITDGPFEAECEGSIIQVALVQYTISKAVVADIWVDVTALVNT